MCPYYEDCPAKVGGCMEHDKRPTGDCVPYVIGGYKIIMRRYKPDPATFKRKETGYGAE